MPRGRKPSPKLWNPYQADILGPFSGDLLISGDTPMAAATTFLANLGDFYRPPENETEMLMNLMMRWGVGDVVRRKFGVNIQPTLGAKPLDRNSKRLVKQEGLLLTKLLNLVSDVYLLRPYDYPHPVYWWIGCAMEGCSLRGLYGSNGGWPTSKTETVRGFESFTASLKARENPFTLPNSERLFDTALEIADYSTGARQDEDEFYCRSLRPYIQARSDAAKVLRKKETKGFKKK